MTYIQQKVVAIVMLGYRNTSLMVCRRGRVSQFVSSDLGFIQMVRKVMGNVAGQEETTLASAIALAGVKISPTPLEKVLRHSSSDARQQELDKLMAAIELSCQDYRILIENWLHKSLPDGVDEILFCGGTADYLGEQGWHFQQSYALYWHGRLQLPTTLESMGLGYRMLDVWGLWQWHQERTFDGVQSASAKIIG
jgi:hypothetical protein